MLLLRWHPWRACVEEKCIIALVLRPENLIKEALRNNYDLRTAIARTQEARAYVGVARSAYYPSVGFDWGVQRDLGVYKFRPALDLPAAELPRMNCLWAVFPLPGD